jgi:hypothetical protein
MNRRAALMEPAGATAAAQLDRSAWDQAMARLQQVKAKSDEFDEPLDAITAAYRAAVDKVPHVTLRPDPYAGRADLVTTADAARGKLCRRKRVPRRGSPKSACSIVEWRCELQRP